MQKHEVLMERDGVRTEVEARHGSVAVMEAHGWKVVDPDGDAKVPAGDDKGEQPEGGVTVSVQVPPADKQTAAAFGEQVAKVVGRAGRRNR